MSRDRETRDLREQLREVIGTDRWVVGDYSAVAPADGEEVSRLLKGYDGRVMVVGGGTDFPVEFQPPPDALVLLTSRITAPFEIFPADGNVVVGAGVPIGEVNRRLKEAGFRVSSLARFQRGTVGGRLAAVSSAATAGVVTGWVQSLLGITAVLADGALVGSGGRCLKDVAGYDLKHLFTGSRGALGVIIAAVFKILPSTDSPPADPLPKRPPHPPEGAVRDIFDLRGRLVPGA